MKTNVKFALGVMLLMAVVFVVGLLFSIVEMLLSHDTMTIVIKNNLTSCLNFDSLITIILLLFMMQK